MQWKLLTKQKYVFDGNSCVPHINGEKFGVARLSSVNFGDNIHIYNHTCGWLNTFPCDGVGVRAMRG